MRAVNSLEVILKLDRKKAEAEGYGVLVHTCAVFKHIGELIATIEPNAV